MSTTNCESVANLTAVSDEKPAATATLPTSGLDTILMALQALKKAPARKVDKEAHTSNLPTTSLPSAPPTDVLSMPQTINSAWRVVSTDTIVDGDGDGDGDIEPTPSEHAPQVKEEEKASSTDAASSSDEVLDTTYSSIMEKARKSKAENPSPSPTLPGSEIIVDKNTAPTDDNSKAADFSHILADPEGWLKQTDNLFVKLPPVDMTCSKEIVVQPNDVLCGRGGETNHHPGNIRYRSLVKAYQKLYLLAKRRDKPKIAQCIVVSVRGVEGRFLRRTKNAIKGNVWVDVGNVKAREKTSQALREGAPNLRETVSPTVTRSASNDGTSAEMLVQEQPKTMTAPPAASPPTLPTSAPTALQSMMGWKAANPPVPPISSSAPLPPPSDADNEAYFKIFSKATADLMKHPLFHQLDQFQQFEAILFECKNARAAVESAKRNQEQGRVSPMIAAQQQAPQTQQHRHPYAAPEYPYYQQHGQKHHYPPPMHGGYWPDGNISTPKIPSSMDVQPEKALSLLASKFAASQADNKSVDLQKMYRGVLAASSSLVSTDKKDREGSSSDEEQRMAKKRPLSCPSTSVPPMISAAVVVSDTGSDASSTYSASSTAVKEEKNEIATLVSRGGSRLKRLKLRMKNDFD